MPVNIGSRLNALLAIAFSVLAIGGVDARYADAQSPPASYYGIAGPADNVEARHNGVTCGGVTAAPDGFWSLKVSAGGACGIAEDGTLAFFRNGADSGARETFKSGGVPASISDGVNVGGGPLQPAPAPQSIPAPQAFSGEAPGPGGAALLVTTREATPQALRIALEGAGCRLQALAILRESRWLVYIEGAPAMVNAAFPASLPETSAFFAHC